MDQVRKCLQGHWGLAVGGWGICAVVGAIPVVGPVLISGPLELGMATLFLALGRAKSVSFDMVFHGFRRYGTALAAQVLVTLFILLWSLLLIVPGVMAALAYAMTFYVIRDNPDISALEAIRLNKQAMRGNNGSVSASIGGFLDGRCSGF